VVRLKAEKQAAIEAAKAQQDKLKHDIECLETANNFKMHELEQAARRGFAGTSVRTGVRNSTQRPLTALQTPRNPVFGTAQSPRRRDNRTLGGVSQMAPNHSPETASQARNRSPEKPAVRVAQLKLGAPTRGQFQVCIFISFI